MGRAHRLSILVAAVGGVLASRSLNAKNASWLAPGDDSWTSPAAWSINPSYPNNGSPDSADLYDVAIAAIGSPYTVTLNSDITISSLLLNSPDATLRQTSGTLRLADGGATINTGTYQLSGGTISSDDAITIASRFDWIGGTLAGLGPVNIASTGSLNLTANSSSRTLSRTINNSGTVNLSAGFLGFNNGTLNNLAGGILNLTTGTFLPSTGSSSLIHNNGTINATPAAGGMVFTGPLLNSATINVAGGSLHFIRIGHVHARFQRHPHRPGPDRTRREYALQSGCRRSADACRQ